MFMGDSGSLICGFLVAVMGIRFVEVASISYSPALAIGILIIPIFDTIKVFTVRILNGKSPFDPDKNHIHHKLLELGLSQVYVVAVLALINCFVICFMLINSSLGNGLLILFTGGILFFFSSILDLRLVKLKVNVKENI
jgi:UDP-GlcNAc:undecaprenyl-phosphate/decaprenyl-phosphate GlcNAc-1-phosphate transferase